MNTTVPWKYRWSHQAALHRSAVKLGTQALSFAPAELKYRLAHRFKREALPYSLVPGGVAVQVGAPYDTLAAGRSRAAHLGLAAGPEGGLVVIEPFARSCEIFEDFAKRYLPCETVVINAGAWSEAGTIDLEVDESHPATNFSQGTVDYSDERRQAFRQVTVRSDALDDLVEEAGLGHPTLVSVTTNWAEREILKGTKRLRAAGLPYIALALGADNEDYVAEMADLGYSLLGHEDRGASFQRVSETAECIRGHSQ